MTDKIEGTCSVCLRDIQLRDDRPIRHGFKAYGVRHGQHSGYHTGPCRGSEYPYLGVSDQGTKWALADTNQQFGPVITELERLKRRPTLTWYPEKRTGHGIRKVRLPDFDHPQTVKPGDARRDYMPSGSMGFSLMETIPSYDELLKRKVTEQQAVRDYLEQWQHRYEQILASYSPAKYQGKGVVKKEPLVHKEHQYRRISGGVETFYPGNLCRFAKKGSVAQLTARRTTDPSKVTCPACRKKLGIS